MLLLNKTNSYKVLFCCTLKQLSFFPKTPVEFTFFCSISFFLHPFFMSSDMISTSPYDPLSFFYKTFTVVAKHWVRTPRTQLHHPWEKWSKSSECKFYGLEEEQILADYKFFNLSSYSDSACILNFPSTCPKHLNSLKKS